METKKRKKKPIWATILTVLLVLIFLALILAVSWAGTCGVIYLITLCFDWQFKWSIATGIWLVLCLIAPVFKASVTVKK